MIGKFARSIAGHDKGTLYIITEATWDKVGVCDGKYKLLSSPKLKNRKHLQIMNKSVDEEVINAINEDASNVNEMIRLAIKREDRDV